MIFSARLRIFANTTSVSRRLLTIGLFAQAMITPMVHAAEQPVCLYISSYHQGFEWSDGIQQGVYQELGNKCRIVQFDMDTKRHKSASHMKKVTKQALELIKSVDPDVVITSDDNAARHVIVPHLANTSTPVIFSGVNWTVEEYGFPLPNVTGIVEVAPIKPMLQEAKKLLPKASHALYLGPATLTERKNYERYEKAAHDAELEISSRLVETFEQWKAALLEAQEYDFVIIGSHSGIPDWKADEAKLHALNVTRKLSLTTHDWMMPVTSLGFTTLPEEQGEWAAASAVAVLNGVSPGSIPIVTNRKWDSWVNKKLLELIPVDMDEALVSRAKQHN